METSIQPKSEQTPKPADDNTQLLKNWIKDALPKIVADLLTEKKQPAPTIDRPQTIDTLSYEGIEPLSDDEIETLRSAADAAWKEETQNTMKEMWLSGLDLDTMKETWLSGLVYREMKTTTIEADAEDKATAALPTTLQSERARMAAAAAVNNGMKKAESTLQEWTQEELRKIPADAPSMDRDAAMLAARSRAEERMRAQLQNEYNEQIRKRLYLKVMLPKALFERFAPKVRELSDEFDKFRLRGLDGPRLRERDPSWNGEITIWNGGRLNSKVFLVTDNAVYLKREHNSGGLKTTYYEAATKETLLLKAGLELGDIQENKDLSLPQDGLREKKGNRR